MRRSALLALVCAAAACSLQGTATGSNELQNPPLVTAAGVDGNIGQDPGCMPFAASGHFVKARIELRTARRRVGPYSVDLASFTGNDAGSYAPPIIQADAGDALRIDLVNSLDSVTSEPTTHVSNLHTHGLIVSPRPNLSVAGFPCVPGDYVFQTVAPNAAPLTRSYRIDIPTAIPASFFDLTPAPGSPLTVAHPSGLYWFHAHFHSQARAQVSDGMAGLLSVGDPKTHIRVDRLRSDGIVEPDPMLTEELRERTDVKYLALRDIQLESASLPDVAAPGTQAVDAAANNFDSQLCQSKEKDGTDIANATVAQGPGWCGVRIAAPGVPPKARAWLLTVNGQLAPTITVGPNRFHLWRVANISASTVYRLALVDPADPKAQLDLCAVSIDGVVAGETGKSAACGTQGAHANYRHVGFAVPGLLLMPGARAEFFVRNLSTAPNAPRRLVLRTTGVQTGPAGDPWPAADLANVVMQGQGTDPAQRVAGLLADLVSSSPAPAVARAAARFPIATPAITDCRFLPPDSAAKAYRRRVIFDENSDTHPLDFAFGLGTDAATGPIGSPTLQGVIKVDSFMHHMHEGQVPPDGPPPGAHACALLGRGEVWELINLTDELHNFHIHQGKFRLATGQDPGAPAELLTHAPIYGACGDWTGVPGIKPDCGTPLGGPPTAAASTIQAWHDTFPIPPRVDSKHPGRVFVWIPFEAREQVGDFVYHCHILEHEDGGMMAHIQVVDPAHPTLRAAIDGAMCRTGL